MPGELPGEVFVSFMSQHLVALIVEYEIVGQQPKHSSVAFTGFVIDLDGEWYWATAGHCLGEELDDKLRQGVKLLRAGFADYFSLGAQHFHLVPYPYEVGCGLYLDNRELALDFGLIQIPLLTRKAFEKNGVVPVRNWSYPANQEFSYYKILGFPLHLSRFEEMSDGTLTTGIRPITVGIERLDPTQVMDCPAEAWFAGQIPKEAQIESIKGMSGGPIFGFFRPEGEPWQYYTVALQSWWRPGSRITFGCSVPRFMEAVRRALRNRSSPPLAP